MIETAVWLRPDGSSGPKAFPGADGRTTAGPFPLLPSSLPPPPPLPRPSRSRHKSHLQMTFPLLCNCLLDRRTWQPDSCTIQVAEMNAVLPTEGRESRKPLLGVHSKRLTDLRARDGAARGRKCRGSSRQSGSVLPGQAPNASGGMRIREGELYAHGMRTTDATKCNVDLHVHKNPDIVNFVVVDVVPCVSDRNFKITGRCWESIWVASVASCRKPGSRSRRFETTHHKARDMLNNVPFFIAR